MNRNTVFILPSATGEETIDNSKSISFDVVTDLSIKKSRSITTSPLATGGFISEHLADKGGTINIEGYVSGNPIVLYQNNLIPTVDSDSRAQAGYVVLNSLYNSQSTVTIVHKFETVNNYFLTDFEPIVTADDSIGFRLAFSEVRYASEQRVTLFTNMSDSKAIASAQNISGGDTQVSKSSAQEEEETWLLSDHWKDFNKFIKLDFTATETTTKTETTTE